MSEQKTKWSCPKCGAENPAEQRVCSQCGNPPVEAAGPSKRRLARRIAAAVLCALALVLIITGGSEMRRVDAEESEDAELAFYQNHYQECVQGIEDVNDLARRRGDPYLLKGTIVSKYEEMMGIDQENIDRIKNSYRERQNGAVTRCCIGAGMLAAAAVIALVRKKGA